MKVYGTYLRSRIRLILPIGVQKLGTDHSISFGTSLQHTKQQLRSTDVTPTLGKSLFRKILWTVLFEWYLALKPYGISLQWILPVLFMFFKQSQTALLVYFKVACCAASWWSSQKSRTSIFGESLPLYSRSFFACSVDVPSDFFSSYSSQGCFFL